MIDNNASQCGYCTPGIVLSLISVYNSNTPLNKNELEYQLTGNICRCTGYNSILEAAITINNSKKDFTYSYIIQRKLIY